MGCDRDGMTKIEFLVVFVCSGILLGLLLPEVRRRGGASRKAQCSFNIRNFALATIQYENSKGHFPHWAQKFGSFAGGSDPSMPGATAGIHDKIGTWTVALLPYLDAQATYEVWTEDKYPILSSGTDNNPSSSGQAGVGYTINAAPNLEIMQCPTSPMNQSDHGRNSYVANMGFCYRTAPGFGGPAGESPFTLERSMSGANGVLSNGHAGLLPDGTVAAVGNNLTLADFHDGQGYTVLFSENLQAQPWHRAGLIMDSYRAGDNDLAPGGDVTKVAYDVSSRYAQGFVWHWADSEMKTSGGGDVRPMNVKPAWRINGGIGSEDKLNVQFNRSTMYDLARPSSAHANGVNMAFADGSVRFILDSIDYRVYQALMTPDGGNSDVPDPTYLLDTESL